jgi:nitroimidazol reductase NimA-like FMN-containing flavoprotein (pyridoxamine 5'-phosphate oxidase superfamily)
MRDDRNRSTATSQNAMTTSERDAFLGASRVSRAATVRSDGWPHVAPCWYIWADGLLVHSFGGTRTHLRNLRSDPRITEVVDIDERPGRGLAGGAAGVMCFGEAEIIEDHGENVEWNRRILQRYLPPADAARYLELSIAEIPLGRRIVTVRPLRFVTWDYGKAM